MPHSEKRNLSLVLKAQFPFPFDIDRYVDEAIRLGVSDPATYVYARVLRSPEFRRRFGGIFKPDGTLRISPEEYIRREEQFASTAAEFGFGLNRRLVGFLVSRDVDPREFTLRARGVQRAKTNPQVLEALQKQVRDINATRRERGQKPIPEIRTLADATNFLLGKGDRQVYEIYEAAEFQASAKAAGLEVSTARGRQLARQTPGVLSPEEAEERFLNIARTLRQASPEIRLFVERQGIRAQTALETLEFGGPGRGKIALQVEQALKQAQAAVKGGRARPPVGITREGRPVVQGVTQEAGL